MNEPQINVDHFYHRPTYHVVGLQRLGYETTLDLYDEALKDGDLSRTL